MALIFFCSTKINHTCFDGTVKYHQPPHIFTTSCRLKFFLCKLPLFKRFFLVFFSNEILTEWIDSLLHWFFFTFTNVTSPSPHWFFASLYFREISLAHFTAMLGEGWEALICLCVMNTRNVRFFTNNQYEVIFEPNNKYYFFTYINMWKSLPLR